MSLRIAVEMPVLGLVMTSEQFREPWAPHLERNLVDGGNNLVASATADNLGMELGSGQIMDVSLYQNSVDRFTRLLRIIDSGYMDKLYITPEALAFRAFRYIEQHASRQNMPIGIMRKV